MVKTREEELKNNCRCLGSLRKTDTSGMICLTCGKQIKSYHKLRYDAYQREIERQQKIIQKAIKKILGIQVKFINPSLMEIE